MKTVIVSVISLVVGGVIGAFLWRSHAEREKTEIVQMMVRGTEKADAAEAAVDTLAIEAIASGEPQRAAQILSHPIAYYYVVYREDGSGGQRSKMLARIEELARTNQLVAAQIAESEKHSAFQSRGRDSAGQPDGAASGSQQIRSGTNQMPAAAGSGR